MVSFLTTVERYLKSVENFKDELKQLNPESCDDEMVERLKNRWLVLEIHQAMLMSAIKRKF